MMDAGWGIFGFGMLAMALWILIWIALAGFVFGLAFWAARKVVYGGRNGRKK